jgi:hypothetical protein
LTAIQLNHGPTQALALAVLANQVMQALARN